METSFYTIEEMFALHRSGKLVRSITEVDSNPSKFQNVHIYDRKLRSEEEAKNDVLVSYTQECKDMLNEKVRLMFSNESAKLMMNKIFLQNAVDKDNSICTSDLLCDIFIRRMSIDIFFLLEEQLSDTWSLGQCAQGVTTRLMQIRRMVI